MACRRRCAALALVVAGLGLAVAAEKRLIVRVRLGNGVVRKVAVGQSSPVASLLLEAGPLYRDAACAEAVDEAQTIAEAGLGHGDMVYAARVAAPEKEWEPYPKLSKRRSRRLGRVTKLDDLSASTHDLSVVEERVCREARVAGEALDGVEDGATVFGERLDDGAVECLAATADAELAAKLGLVPVGCAVLAESVDARIATLAARAHLEAMRSLRKSGGPFPFVLLLCDATDDLRVEAFEITETFVQMMAEGLVALEEDPRDDLVRLRAPALVARREADAVDPVYLYRPVPIVSAETRFTATLDHRGDDRAVLAAALGPHLGDPAALARRCLDFPLLARLRRLLTRADFDTLCRVLRDRDAPLPANLAAVLGQLAAADSSSRESAAARPRPGSTTTTTTRRRPKKP